MLNTGGAYANNLKIRGFEPNVQLLIDWHARILMQ
jgi:hypothetical protein